MNIIKKPDSTDWLFDSSILPVRKTKKENIKPIVYNYNLNGDYQLLIKQFKFFNLNQQQFIKNELYKAFRKLDIHNETLLYIILFRNQIIGWLCTRSNNEILDSLHNKYDPNFIETPYKPDGVYIYNFWIIQNFRGMGIGTLLLSKVITILKEKRIKSISAQVDSDNIGSLKVFQKMNFIIENQIQLNHKNVLNMTKWL